MDLVASQLDHFTGDNPTPDQNVTAGPGWGCDSKKDAPWVDSSTGFAGRLMIPSCVPRSDGFGPYRASPAKNVPTILDRLDAAGLGWKIYSDTNAIKRTNGYIWSICPTFAECFYDINNGNKPNPDWVARSQFAIDASKGQLPAYSVIAPDSPNSQHNGNSMLQGDNYIETFVKDVMNGPSAQWQSTAFFITYDDCGCFYDHVPPPPNSGLGIRVPMVIVSPQAKAAFVDDKLANFASMNAFVEKNWGLAPLTSEDAAAYDYCNSFVFTTLPCTGAAAGTRATPGRRAPTQVPLNLSPVSKASKDYVATHPPDPNDPT
jgi:phospholipase C